MSNIKFEKEQLLDDIKDSMNNHYFMLEKGCRPYIYIGTVISDIDVRLNKYFEDEDTKE